MESLLITLSEIENDQPQEGENGQRGPISKNHIQDLQAIFSTSEASLWEEVVSRNISLASLVRSLSTTMESPGTIGLLASNLYLTILLSDGSPLYTLFNPVAFHSLLRSIRNSLKQSSQRFPSKPNSKKTQLRRKTKNAKRINDSEEDEALEPESQEKDGNPQGFDANILISVLENLDLVMHNLRLDGYFDSLKYLIEVVSELPMLACDFNGFTEENAATRGGKSRKVVSSSVPSPPPYESLCRLCYKIMERVLIQENGDRTLTSVEIFKMLARSILCQKSQVRVSALRFVINKVIPTESDLIRKALISLPRYLAMKAPEKTEPRALAVESIIAIIKAMNTSEQMGFAGFVMKMTQGKPRLRMIAMDLIPSLLGSLPDPLGLKEDQNFWGLRCLEALLHRCSDKVAGIRARALTNMANAIELLASDIRNRSRLQELLGFGGMGRPNNLQEKQETEEGLEAEARNAGLLFGDLRPSPFSGPGPTPITPGVGCEDLNVLLRRRCVDEKAAVRKAALFLITKSTSLLGRIPDDVTLKTIGVACSDPLVSIRKAALSALSEVFRKFPEKRVVKEWLHSVPQLITDNESSVQDECETLFLELVLDHISRVASASSSNNKPKHHIPKASKAVIEKELEMVFPEGILDLLKMICNGEVAPCVKRICASLGKKGRLRSGLALSLQNIITSSESIWVNHSMAIEKWTAPPGAWYLLSEVSVFLPKFVGWKFLNHHWQLLDRNTTEKEIGSPFAWQELEGQDEQDAVSVAWAEDRVHLLKTISNVAKELPPVGAAELAESLLARLMAFNMHPTEVDAHVQALKTLCQRKAIHEKGDQLISKWVDQVLSKALQILDDYVTEVSEMGNLDRFQTPARSGSRKKKAKGKTKMGALNPSVQAVTAIFTLGSLVLVCPSTNLKGFIPLLQTVITSGSLKPKSKEITGLVSVSAKNFSSSFYIQSWVTLGKICLVDDKLAKRYIPLFVQELEKSNSAPLRNNIMVVMTDFCVRYTALVDCYIAKITKSLCDPCEVVRRQTFILLSRLLQRDYVKWRGVLFHRFLFALVDESEKIRQLADFLIGSILKTKAPLLAYNSFVEAIFVLNGCDAHGGHSEYQSSHSESRLFSLRGPDEKTQSQRMHIYVSLLKQMAPEHLLATSAKLCAEILAAAADGLLDLNDSTGKSVLKDALQILACKEMRLQSARNTPLATDLEEEGVPPAASAFTVAKGRVVSQVAKKSLVQNAIPIFIELKKVLESRNSPLLGCLMECLRVLLKEYNNEIDEILLADKQLQKEILYDMRKYEASKAKSTVVEAMATIRRSGGYHSSVGKTSDTQANNGGGSHSRPTSIGGDRIYKAAKPSVAPNCRLSCSNSGIRGPCPKPNLGIDAGGDGINLGPNGIGGEGFSRSNICSRVQSNGNLKSSSYVDGLFRGESSNRGNCSSAVKSTDVGGGDLEGEFGNSERIVSAVADMAAAATVNVVLKDVNGGTSTPPLGTMSIPKLKGSLSDASRKSNCSQVLESLRRRETFNGSEEG
ncbi:condensin-2 complex subunit D3 isoform X1 [Amborella trichopoda]|uniref:Condensin complex subunit 1 C-terminal domain-containing protein n=1 Tax=Amborella trichopoda TaxID=13333 RepID=W1P3N8_AMBTC|nr:condensin-2 complex subunit D3 isoform X1 [Amborella trichopoda]ERN02249.1 hypothetical protein AMTR_s00045p00227490 [Amborella trichopoda]|eukprot:XP_020520611.1 condensin-2 complex subunit D3 isoform X1 [Amborella trichopoda]